MESSGAGGTNLTGLSVARLVVRISGSGPVDLSGRASTQQVQISGSGAYDGHDLSSQQAGVLVVGSGCLRVDVSKRLSADVAGSGDVRYTGSPKQVQQHTTGSGRVHPD